MLLPSWLSQIHITSRSEVCLEYSSTSCFFKLPSSVCFNLFRDFTKYLKMRWDVKCGCGDGQGGGQGSPSVHHLPAAPPPHLLHWPPCTVYCPHHSGKSVMCDMWQVLGHSPRSPPLSRWPPLCTPRSRRCCTDTGTPRSGGSCARCWAWPAPGGRTRTRPYPLAGCSAASPCSRVGRLQREGGGRGLASPVGTSHPRGHHSPELGVILDMSRCWVKLLPVNKVLQSWINF